MADFINSGPRLNRGKDLLLWVLVLGSLVLVPLIIGFTIPEQQMEGPIWNPSVLILFLGFLGLIILVSLRCYLLLVQRRAQHRADRPLANSEYGWVNALAKLIGGLFIVSGFVKLQDITGFSIKLDEYWDVFGMAFLKPFSVGLAWFISVFEVAIAFALMTAYRMRITTFFMMAMIVFFTFLTGYSAITGSVTDCGCFGDALKLTPLQSFIKDLFLLFAIIPLYVLRKRIPPFYRGVLPGALTLLAFVVFGVISWYAYQHLPLFGFRGAYKVGQNFAYNTQNVGDDDLPIAHEFYMSEFCKDCGAGDGFKGATMYVILYNPEKTSEAAVMDLGKFSQEMREQAPDILLCGATNLGSSDREKYRYKYNLDFCMAPADEKGLKTMIRSSPGYMLLKDGVILEKWHHNDRPTVEEIRSLLQ